MPPACTLGKRSIYAALAANLAIAIAKFIGASLSGSSVMLSAGFHAVVDSTNELLLLHGLKQSEAEPDEDYPLGRGQELYFWALNGGSFDCCPRPSTQPRPSLSCSILIC
ncbi:cation transporter [Spirulina major CS-329]|nr:MULTISPECIES: cation transporter [Spirulina]MDB9494960.1 cation transporter [Spirulina subsalsa CS-330]MDB9503839.1 cation transporter [Spirulina major CS-329]